MKHALVTGCAGFIGSHLVERLLRDGWRVTGIDSFHPYYGRDVKTANMGSFRNRDGFEFIHGSVLDADSVSSCRGADAVFHLAAVAGTRDSFGDPGEYFKNNTEGTGRLLEELAASVGSFVFASSSSVYGNVPEGDLPVRESRDLAPVSPYGESKMLAENLCRRYSADPDLDLSILRFHTVYGPRQRTDEAVIKFIMMALDGRALPVYGDGTQTRDFTFVSDVVDGMMLAQKHGRGEYNIGSGSPVSVNRMIDVIEGAIGTEIRREYTDHLPRGDVRATHADISKARRDLGFNPKIDLTSGIGATIKWYGLDLDWRSAH